MYFGQGLQASAAHLYPNIGRVPTPTPTPPPPHPYLVPHLVTEVFRQAAPAFLHNKPPPLPISYVAISYLLLRLII